MIDRDFERQKLETPQMDWTCRSAPSEDRKMLNPALFFG
jgi:hypothetical protein